MMNELESVLKRLIEFHLLTHQEEEIIHRSLLTIEIQIMPKTRYIEFIEEFNTITKKKYKPDIESRELFYENDSLYSNADRLKALRNAMSDPYIKERSTILTPVWLLKPETIGKYITYAAPKSNSKSNKDDKETKPDYSKVSV
jgi:hypothetical protein